MLVLQHEHTSFLFVLVCSWFLSALPCLLDRAMKRTSDDMLAFDSNDSSQRPIAPKRATPSDRNITIWAENLQPQCGCLSAAFNMDAQGIVDGLKTEIVSRFSNPRFGLCKKQFRLLQGSEHKQFVEKLSSLNCELPVRFQWSAYTAEHRSPLEYRP